MRGFGLLAVAMLGACGEVPNEAEVTPKTENTIVAQPAPLPEGAPKAPITGLCADATCERSMAEFEGKDWPRSWAGDYQAQRNVAYCLSNGCDGAVQVNRTAACAWRMVILAAAHDSAGDGDVVNMKADCGKLDEAGIAAARIKAERLAERIAKIAPPNPS